VSERSFDKELARRITFWDDSHAVTATYNAGTDGLQVRTRHGYIVARYFGRQYRAVDESGGVAIYSMLPTANLLNWEDVNVG
jgi:hypothetical protein